MEGRLQSTVEGAQSVGAQAVSANNWAKCPKCGKEDSLREDYEVGITGKEFEVIYHGECLYARNPGCGLKYIYRYAQKVLP